MRYVELPFGIKCYVYLIVTNNKANNCGALNVCQAYSRVLHVYKLLQFSQQSYEVVTITTGIIFKVYNNQNGTDTDH